MLQTVKQMDLNLLLHTESDPNELSPGDIGPRKMITLRESRTSVWETNRSLCRDPYDSSQGFYSSQSPFIIIITPGYSVCVDRSPADQPPGNGTLGYQ